MKWGNRSHERCGKSQLFRCANGAVERLQGGWGGGGGEETTTPNPHNPLWEAQNLFPHFIVVDKTVLRHLLHKVNFSWEPVQPLWCIFHMHCILLLLWCTTLTCHTCIVQDRTQHAIWTQLKLISLSLFISIEQSQLYQQWRTTQLRTKIQSLSGFIAKQK